MTPSEIQDLIAALRAAGVRRFKQGDLEIELGGLPSNENPESQDIRPAGDVHGGGDPELVAREVLAAEAKARMTSPTARDLYEQPGLWPGGRVPRFPEKGQYQPNAQFTPKE